MMMDEHDEQAAAAFEELRAAVMEGVEDLRNGNYVEYTDETLHELMEEIGRRGRERAQASNM